MLRPSASLLILALAASGCGDADEPAPAPTTKPPDAGCAAGEVTATDGRCNPAGLPPDMPCPPAEWLRDDGVCIPAGVAPDGCGQGFVHDGDRGCEPSLPDAPCPPGLMAVPGDATCREVAPCPAGTWGDIPVEPNTEYVDANYPGTDSDGSALKPWTSVQAGVDAASPGAIVAIAAGSYHEDVTVAAKPVRLWGVCPALAEVVGTGTEIGAIVVVSGAGGTEVRDLAVQGDALGFAVSGSLDVLLERVWVHDTGDRGIEVADAYGPTSVTVHASLIEQTHNNGVYLYGAEGTLEANVVRDVQPNAQGQFGRGVSAESHSTKSATLFLRSSVIERAHDTGVFVGGSKATVEASVIHDTQQVAAGYGRGFVGGVNSNVPAVVTLRSSLFEQNHDAAVFIEGSEATVEACVVRDTLPDEVNGLEAFAIAAQAESTTGAAATLVVRTSLVERTHGVGVYVYGSQATVDGIAIRDGSPEANGVSGRGLSAEPNLMSGARSTLSLTSSLIERSHEVGVFVEGTDAVVEACAVRDTQPDGQGLFGRGISAQAEPTTTASTKLTVHASVVEHNYDLGVFLAGAEGSVEASVIRDTQPDGKGLGGHGVHARKHPAFGATSTLDLRSSLVEQSAEAGVAILGSTGTIDACLIRETRSSPGWGGGEGVIVVSDPDSASAAITRTRIHQSELAAVAAWGAHAAIGGSAMSCQAFDLNSESYGGVPAQLEDLGDNVCGCPEPTGTCTAASAGLAPPSPLEPQN